MQVFVLSRMVVGVRKGFRWTNKNRLVGIEDLSCVMHDNKVIVKLISKRTTM